jgi:hypothetical protein
VDEVLAAVGARFAVTTRVVAAAEESVTFGLPRELRDAADPPAGEKAPPRVHAEAASG